MLSKSDRVSRLIVVTCSVIISVCLAGGNKNEKNFRCSIGKEAKGFDCRFRKLSYLSSMDEVTGNT